MTKKQFNTAMQVSLPTIFLWAIGSLFTSGVIAEANDFPVVDRWYHVEVIIFSQQGDYREQWPTDIALAYPPNWRAFESLNEKTIESTTGQLTPPDGLTINDIAIGEVTEKTVGGIKPYLFLSESDQVLKPQATALQRDNRYHVLFHQAWRQPMKAAEIAPALLIKGGKEYGEHHELEGTLSLSISRYLHLNTNLWLSQFVRNLGEGHGEWPPLPQSPDKKQALAEQWLKEKTPDNLWADIKAPEDDFEKILNQPYRVNQIVLMKQKRRMRSGETHYLDHPKLGIIIRIDPFELPTPVTQDESSPIIQKAAISTL